MTEWETLVAPVDRDNTRRLREIIGRRGWPGRRLAGDDGAHAAWLLVQHAPPDLQEECVPLLEDAVARGDARPADLAYLTDRVLAHRGGRRPRTGRAYWQPAGAGRPADVRPTSPPADVPMNTQPTAESGRCA